MAFMLAVMIQVFQQDWTKGRLMMRQQSSVVQTAIPLYSTYLSSKFCLVFDVPWSCSQAITTTRAPQSFPFYKYLTDLAPLLTCRVLACTNLLLSLMSNANPLTSHLKLSTLNPYIITQYILIKYFEKWV